MMIKNVLALMAFLASCKPHVPPPYTPLPYDPAETCKSACTVMRGMPTCATAVEFVAPTRNGGTCEDVCLNTERSGVDFGSVCFSHATSCQAVEACAK